MNIDTFFALSTLRDKTPEEFVELVEEYKQISPLIMDATKEVTKVLEDKLDNLDQVEIVLNSAKAIMNQKYQRKSEQ